MNFFLQTASHVFKAFGFIIKGDEQARNHIAVTEAHFWLSWLMVVFATFIYMIYLPNAFLGSISQAGLPEETSFSDFKSANMLSLVLVLFAGYLVVYLFEKPLNYTGSFRQYVISQNWVFLLTIILLVPLSTATSTLQEWSPMVSILIFVFMFILFFAYRCIRIMLGLNGPKAFMLLVVLLFLELVMDNYIDRWFGLVAVAQTQA